jgi:hydrogenase maturation protease
VTTGEDVKTLVIGYGNPGRLDDGLGPALAEALAAMRLPGVTVDADYQLTVEDAADVARHDVAVFADAAVAGREPFFFRRIRPEASLSFSSHHVEPGALLTLARDCFGTETAGYALGVRGYEFNEFGERLSEGAVRNLTSAVAFLEDVLKHESFEQAVIE